MSNKTMKPLFNKDNYMLILVGGIVIILGIFLMAGGKSADPNVFNKDEVYSKTRITVAPVLIMIGFCIEIVAIFFNRKKVSSN